MTDYKISLLVPTYLQQWMYFAFGNPVQLIRDSPESRLLCQMLRKTPEEPETLESYEEQLLQVSTHDHDDIVLVPVVIEIPFYKSKPPREFSVLNIYGKQAMVESFKTLFKKDILNTVSHLRNTNCKQKTLIYNYMDEHGIEIEHYDTIKQIYYRNVKKYLTNNNIKI
jgi:hypothetical protein